MTSHFWLPRCINTLCCSRVRTPSERSKSDCLLVVMTFPPPSSLRCLFHDMFVHSSGLGRVQGTKNETLALHDPRQVSKPEYEATALQARPSISIGYPHSANGQYALYYSTRAALPSGEATSEEPRPKSMSPPITPRHFNISLLLS